MTEAIFDHDRLDVYRLSIEYVACAKPEGDRSKVVVDADVSFEQEITEGKSNVFILRFLCLLLFNRRGHF